MSGQLELWDESFEKEFSGWKRRDIKRSELNKEDFRQYVINLNSEFNVEEILDKLEIGLLAFEKLNQFIPRFPNFDLNKVLETFYDEKKNAYVKDFIKLGVE